ncbi:SDR family oxidoreductase [Blastococcus sp. BMG 814]|uniref:SDR family oxidoreductase n=1 Tax=Blastococcus carthaginiensis TaxID=3050034 RepID=A0ABT9IBT3_9ACTN|nr:SDR family oxidoreductase [Blastococcus carthaginiensis]MDP5182682.1 SDR family oxidoreductase [Blastococcus carthaginiensis]
MDLGLDGRRAAVAAATGGLGYATAAALVTEGVRVTICGSDPARAEAAAGRLGAGTAWVVADLADPGEGERFVRLAQEAMGGVDILVPNAPGPPAGTFTQVGADQYAPALELSLLSTVRMCLAAVPGMREQGWGRVVAITSIAVRQPVPNLILSNTARAGLTGFLKTLAREVAPDGVTVNSVQPGLHDTERLRQVWGDGITAEVARIPARSLGRPEDFGAAVAFLCSESARYITGAAVPLDGGMNQGLQ